MTAFSENAEPIASAPRDGRAIMLIHDDIGTFIMAWNPAATNHLFAPGVIGMWEAPDGSMTWREGEEGPTHWRPLADPAPDIDPTTQVFTSAHGA